MTTTLEKDIEKKLVNLVTRYGGLCLKWTCPAWSGVPDRICLLPGGRVIFVETKRPQGGKVSKLQTWWANKINRMGFLHLFVKDEDDLRALAEYL